MGVSGFLGLESQDDHRDHENGPENPDNDRVYDGQGRQPNPRTVPRQEAVERIAHKQVANKLGQRDNILGKDFRLHHAFPRTVGLIAQLWRCDHGECYEPAIRETRKRALRCRQSLL